MGVYSSVMPSLAASFAFLLFFGSAQLLDFGIEIGLCKVRMTGENM